MGAVKKGEHNKAQIIRASINKGADKQASNQSSFYLAMNYFISPASIWQQLFDVIFGDLFHARPFEQCPFERALLNGPFCRRLY